MSNEKLRAWWFARQGLAPGPERPPSVVLQDHGWARSLGGANPYLAIFARHGGGRSAVDASLEAKDIQELPSARGCAYVLPSRHFRMGLLVCQATMGEGQDVKTAKKYLGVTDEEIRALEEGVIQSLKAAPKDPREIMAAVGDLARSLGEEGKKRGVATTLPLALGRLQAQGRIRRMPSDGRLDSQRFRYALWSPSPLESGEHDHGAALQALARLYFSWIGPASLSQFQKFAGLSAVGARNAVSPLGLAPIVDGSELLILPEDRDAFELFSVPREEQVVLVGSLDPLFHLRRDLSSHTGESDGLRIKTREAMLQVGTAEDLAHHAIVDRGRLVGVWEFDPDRSEVVWKTFDQPTEAVRDAVDRMETYVREELGDARSFSLDSPTARKPKLDLLRSS